MDSLELLPNCQNSFLTPLPALNDSDLIPLISVCTKPANTTYFDNNNHFTMLMFRTNDNIDLKNALIANSNTCTAFNILKCVSIDDCSMTVLLFSHSILAQKLKIIIDGAQRIDIFALLYYRICMFVLLYRLTYQHGSAVVVSPLMVPVTITTVVSMLSSLVSTLLCHLDWLIFMHFPSLSKRIQILFFCWSYSPRKGNLPIWILLQYWLEPWEAKLPKC